MKILMLTESNYPLDVRVRQEAELLTVNGYRVRVIALKDPNQSYREDIEGVRIYRIPKIELFKSGKQTRRDSFQGFAKVKLILKALFGYGLEFLYFTMACLLLSFPLFVRERFDIIHTHNPPDTLFVIALVYKLFGVKFVYDHHDLSPDLFREKYKKGANSIYHLLLLLERWSCRLADMVIATNESYKQIEIKRCGVNPEKIYVVRNGPDLSKIRRTAPMEGIRQRDETVLCYLGAINNQDGLDYLVDAFSHIVQSATDHRWKLLIVGDGDYLPEIKRLVAEQHLKPYVHFTGYVANRDLLNRYMSTADIFVDSAPYSFLNDHSTFIKHMEYMVFERPIVTFALKETQYSLGNAGVFIEPNCTRRFAEAVIELNSDLVKSTEIGQNGRVQLNRLSWDQVADQLLMGYQMLGYRAKTPQSSNHASC